ncbi:aminotransferase class V-fold PLP-dependent enzyme [Paenibacillus hunanensis]|uniref:cysteine desulfurase n=1 Tax=Paenibacillus hunanensis TaxID=539262 RepID=A0ABU1J4E1_9BACL|nr:aminotransferase class V-fold PLP-dependent enzyme [Paenibacillus hunanensis]MDR6246375.1 cysteine desulfurase family protein [Paenibacillus hunanensis]GGJ31080.1 cysteine desulfurase [Paenibacillus hunanensis]
MNVQKSARKATSDDIIYLDHAATSWPKPPAVLEAVQHALLHESANPGRGSHRMAVQASRTLLKARQQLARLLDVRNPVDIAFTANTTIALNMAIFGYVRPGDHVIATMTEHNSVWRPLEALKRSTGIQVTYIPVDACGQLDLHEVDQAFTAQTRLLICNHSSNLLGSILPAAELAQLAHRHGARILLDIAQSAGHIPVKLQEWEIDMAAFPGHKGLLGPQGTGGLYIAPELDLSPWLYGGTGSQSEEADQPSVRPDRYEPGTPNTPGIAGLAAGVQYVLDQGIESIAAHEQQLVARLWDGLSDIKGLRVLGPAADEPRTGIVSFVMEQQDPAQIAFQLDRQYGIAVRAGMHCTPLAHRMAGTVATGAVRASVGYGTTEQHVDQLLEAVQFIQRTAK